MSRRIIIPAGLVRNCRAIVRDGKGNVLADVTNTTGRFRDPIYNRRRFIRDGDYGAEVVFRDEAGIEDREVVTTTDPHGTERAIPYLGVTVEYIPNP